MREKILVVDDDAAARAEIASLLTDAHYDVILAASVPSAMQLLQREAPSLLITEIRLSGHNGLQIVALNPAPIPSLVVTGFPDRMLEVESRKLGADYMTKPVSPPLLLSWVEQKLAQARQPAAYNAIRRWVRKPVAAGLVARVDESVARIVDISYGGLRLEIERAPGAWLPPSFSLVLPSTGVAVEADLVWKKQTDRERWLCGAAITHEAQPVWRDVVDAIG